MGYMGILLLYNTPKATFYLLKRDYMAQCPYGLRQTSHLRDELKSVIYGCWLLILLRGTLRANRTDAHTPHKEHCDYHRTVEGPYLWAVVAESFPVMNGRDM